MDFVAIDFETANECRSSACSLGLCVVRSNVITETRHWLIKPEPYRFNSFNQRVHGLFEKDVIHAQTFDQVWSEVAPYIRNGLIVAHNAPFDVSVLHRALEHYELDCPEFDILCTQRLTQAAFPLMGCYRLNIVSRALGIPLNHHDAKSDAEACALILCHLIDQAQATSLQEIANYYEILPGYHRNDYDDGYAPCRLCGQAPKTHKVTAKDLKGVTPILIDDDLAGRYFAFTGTLIAMTRSRAQEIVAYGGGIPQDSITKKPTIL